MSKGDHLDKWISDQLHKAGAVVLYTQRAGHVLFLPGTEQSLEELVSTDVFEAIEDIFPVSENRGDGKYYFHGRVGIETAVDGEKQIVHGVKIAPWTIEEFSNRFSSISVVGHKQEVSPGRLTTTGSSVVPPSARPDKNYSGSIPNSEIGKILSEHMESKEADRPR